MGSLDKRLKRLESVFDVGTGEEREEEVHREVLLRMTDEELDCYRETLKHAMSGSLGPDAPVSFREEDQLILQRVEELVEEVCVGTTAGDRP